MSMKKKKILAVVLGAVLVVALCCGVALVAGNSEELLLKENQRYVYAYITSIQGNEITYMEMEESVVTAMLEEDTETEEENDQSADTNAEMGEMPEMGSMPEMGEMPNMSNMSENGENTQRGQESGRGGAGRQESGNREKSDDNQMQFGGMTTTVTTYVPVGVTVHTAADVSTTFSRLASGDLVKILVESNDAQEDVILEIWMLQ